MWSKIKSDYDQDIVNFTKSGNDFSSFTVAVMQELKRQDMETLKAPSTAGRTSDEASSSSSSNDDNNDEVEEDPEGSGDKGSVHFIRFLVVIYLHSW
jgi:hypothetical protein